MRKLLLIIQILLLIAPLTAQVKCELPLSDSPPIFGIKLGMSPSEVRMAVDGKLSIKNKPEGVFFQNYIKNKPPAVLSGVRALYLRFFDARLYQLEVFYEQQNEYQTLGEFVDELSAKKSLPREFWKSKHGIAELKCDGFLIIVDNFLNPRLELTDQLLRQEFKEALAKR